MVVMNHFAAAGGPRAAIEAAMEKVAWWLGWHPKFPYAAVGDWIAAQPDAELIERRKLPPLRLFTLLVIGKRAAG
jgi:phosphatidylethanolamine/phosphatidyl-N-methylethanolamine N-methyltransferase